MRTIMSLMFFLLQAGIALAQSPAHQTFGPCARHSVAISWGVRMIGKNQIRFTIDATGADVCTQYYDLEFVAQLLNAQGRQIAKRRFAVTDSIASPTILSFDFPITDPAIVQVKGVALYCKKRISGSLPGADPREDNSDPDIVRATELRDSFKDEVSSYDEWLGATADYVETHPVGTNIIICESGSLSATANDKADDKCSDIKKAAEDLAKKRNEQFGDAITPTKLK
jgi:hypothetical protein